MTFWPKLQDSCSERPITEVFFLFIISQKYLNLLRNAHTTYFFSFFHRALCNQGALFIDRRKMIRIEAGLPRFQYCGKGTSDHLFFVRLYGLCEFATTRWLHRLCIGGAGKTSLDQM